MLGFFFSGRRKICRRRVPPDRQCSQEQQWRQHLLTRPFGAAEDSWSKSDAWQGDWESEGLWLGLHRVTKIRKEDQEQATEEEKFRLFDHPVVPREQKPRYKRSVERHEIKQRREQHIIRQLRHRSGRFCDLVLETTLPEVFEAEAEAKEESEYT